MHAQQLEQYIAMIYSFVGLHFRLLWWKTSSHNTGIFRVRKTTKMALRKRGMPTNPRRDPW